MKRELKIGKTCSGECRGIALQTVPLRRAQTACSSAEQVQKARMTTNHTSAEKCYNSYRSYNGGLVRKTRSMVVSMRLPTESGNRLKRLASRHGWTPSDASARLVEEGLRRSEFAFIDFRDSASGRQAYVQGSSLAVWEVMLLVQSYKANVEAVAKHLKWPETKVQAAV